jgi:hypothetical protein
MGTCSPFPGNKAAGVRQTMNIFVDINFKKSLSQEQKICCRSVNVMNFDIRTLGHLTVFAANSVGTRHK